MPFVEEILKNNKTANLAKIGMLIGISAILVYLRVPYPPAGFLKYDAADVPIFITTFAFGPIVGLLSTVIVSIIQAFILGDDGIYGCLMHIFATGTYVIVAGTIYKCVKGRKTAIIGMFLASLAMTAVMCLANLWITPLFLGVPREAVMPMIIPIIMPFNLLKAGINSLITFALYKRISPVLHR